VGRNHFYFVSWSICIGRHDLAAKIFRPKLTLLFDELIKNGVLEKVVGHMHVIDFEKRAFHILIFLDSASKPRTPEDINRIVSAEINDPDMLPESHDTLFHACFMDLVAFSASTRHHPCISHGKYTKR